jgi:hypothetical protein
MIVESEGTSLELREWRDGMEINSELLFNKMNLMQIHSKELQLL